MKNHSRLIPEHELGDQSTIRKEIVNKAHMQYAELNNITTFEMKTKISMKQKEYVKHFYYENELIITMNDILHYDGNHFHILYSIHDSL